MRAAGGTRWITSEGGPLVVLPGRLLPAWRGIAVPPGTVPHFMGPPPPGLQPYRSDYDRACAVEDYAGCLPVGAGTGLILGDEPDSTTWWPGDAPDVWGYLVRRLVGGGVAPAPERLAHGSLDWEDTGIT